MRILDDFVSPSTYLYKTAFDLALLNTGKWVEIPLADLPGGPVIDKQTRLQQAAKVLGWKFKTRTKFAVPGMLNITFIGSLKKAVL
jgi:hypothetical protein